MDFITALLVQLWDKFKAKNAKVATLIALALGTILYFADQGTLLGIIDLPDWAEAVIKYLTAFLLAVGGSRTSADLAQIKSDEPQG